MRAILANLGMSFFLLLQETFREWQEDKAPQLAAALSYYSVFSLAPLLLLFMIIAGFFVDSQEVQGNILQFFQQNIGTESTEVVKSLLEAAEQGTDSLIMKVWGTILLLVGATGILTQLQLAFNTIWDVQIRKDAGFFVMMQKRILSFGIILVIGFLVLVSFLLSAAIAFAGNIIAEYFAAAEYLLPLAEFLLSFGIMSVLFGVMFRYFPDVELQWKHVWKGGFLTGALFLFGKAVLTWYFATADVASSYGAAGSFIVILLWIYYCSLILFFGAEFTQVSLQRSGIKITPEEIAVVRGKKFQIQIPAMKPWQKLQTMFQVLRTEFKVLAFFLRVKKKIQQFWKRIFS